MMRIVVGALGRRMYRWASGTADGNHVDFPRPTPTVVTKAPDIAQVHAGQCGTCPYYLANSTMPEDGHCPFLTAQRVRQRTPCLVRRYEAEPFIEHFRRVVETWRDEDKA